MVKNKYIRQPYPRSLKWLWGIVFGLVLNSSQAEAQVRRYLVLLKDKAGTPFRLDKPQDFLSQRSVFRRAKQGIQITNRDLPVSPAYVSAIRQTGATVWYTSRWLNAVVIDANPNTLARVLQLSFVQGTEAGRSLDAQTSTTNSLKGIKEDLADLPPLNYGNSLTQIQMMGVDKMHSKGYRGEGMLVAVFDNGFLNVDRNTHFKHLFANKQIVATYDFVNRNPNVYDGGSHGANVLSTLAGRSDSALVGTAFSASFALFHTEEDARETRIEEVNWLVAAEAADSLGADIITSSLGYYSFDDPATDYRYADLTGNKALVTKAADWAAGVGMVVLNAAGNEGNSSWRYVSVPADADSILAVGSVNRLLNYVASSSVGPTADGRIKPDVAAMGQGTILFSPSGFVSSGSGTSYATPLVAGLVAGLWQAYPYLSAMQVIDIIKKSGHQANRPDNQLGYGVPHFERAEALVPKPLQVPASPKSGMLIYPNPFIEGTDPILRLSSEAPARVSLLNLAGHTLWNAELSEEQSNLPIGSMHLSPGVYLLSVQQANAHYVQPLIKQ